MKYVLANLEKVRQHSALDVRARRRDNAGRVMLSEKDLCGVYGDGAATEKLAIISGEFLTSSEAIAEMNKEGWS